MKSAVLYRLAIVDSLVATAFVVGFFWIVPNQEWALEAAKEVDLIVPAIKPLHHGGILLAISLLSALICVSLVMLKVKSENQ
jgi:cell division transport system permease protein